MTDNLVPLPPLFDTDTKLTSLQQVQDECDGVYVCVRCCLHLKPHTDDGQTVHRALFFDDKPSAITHRQNTGHDWGWYPETVYKPFRDGFVHPRIVDAARQLDVTIETVKLVSGTRDQRRNHR